MRRMSISDHHDITDDDVNAYLLGSDYHYFTDVNNTLSAMRSRRASHFSKEKNHMTKLKYILPGDTLEADETFTYARQFTKFAVDEKLSISTPSGDFALQELSQEDGTLRGLKKIETVRREYIPISCSFEPNLTGRTYTYFLPRSFPIPEIGQAIIVLGPKGGRKTVYVTSLTGDVNPAWTYKDVLELVDGEQYRDVVTDLPGTIAVPVQKPDGTVRTEVREHEHEVGDLTAYLNASTSLDDGRALDGVPPLSDDIPVDTVDPHTGKYVDRNGLADDGTPADDKF